MNLLSVCELRCARTMRIFTAATQVVVRNETLRVDCIATSVTGRAARESRVIPGKAAEGDKADNHRGYIAAKFDIYVMAAMDALLRITTPTCLLMSLKT